MHQAEHGIARLDVVHQHPHRAHVEQIFQAYALALHLAPDAEDVLRPSRDFAGDAGTCEFRAQQLDHVADVGLAIHTLLVQLARKILVGIRLQAAKCQVLQLPLDLPHAEPVGERREQVHGIARRVLASLCVASGSQLPQQLHLIGQLDQNHPHVLDHRQQHLAQRLELRRPVGLAGAGLDPSAQHLDLLHARHAFHQCSNRRPEARRQVLALCMGRHLHTKQKCRRNGFPVDAQSAEYADGSAHMLDPTRTRRVQAVGVVFL